VWAFFQNCWHIKDWLKHDYRVRKAVRDRVLKAAHQSRVLRVCADMANGTKHRKLTTARGKPVRARAMHLYTNTTMTPGGEPTKIDCLLKFPRSTIKFRSAREVAEECLGDWVKILKAHGLRTERRS
jgi:hypothetical protein